MDGENSYESDISESWSLIDINLNEESLSAAELEKSHIENVQNLQVLNDTNLDFLEKHKDVKKTNFSQGSDSESDAISNQGLPSKDRTESENIDLSYERSSETIGNHDSCDTESIEILDMDSNTPDSEIERLDISQINQLNFSTYQSDDEESLEGNNTEIRSNNSTVIKRRRKRVSKNLEEAVNSINSETKSTTDNNLTLNSIDKGEQSKSNKECKKVSGNTVYKHYRNNVANTVLSLSVGVIFAGVACIAISHFLGVQDATQTSVELVETLKKLEVENAALQSHLHQLNRALLIREMTPKSELSPLNQPQNKVSYQAIPLKTDFKEDFSGVHNNLNSMEELSRLQNYAQRHNKVTATDYGIDLKEFGKFIKDQLHSLKTKQERGAKILEEADKKISKELQEIISKLSSSQKDMANLNENVIRLKNIIDKIEKMIPESLGKLRSQNSREKRKKPVTESDLQTMGWSRKNEMKGSEPVTLYEFPKLESYYKKEENVQKNEFELANRAPKNDTEKEVKFTKKMKKPKDEKRKKGEKKHSKESWKKKEFKEKSRKGKKGEKKQKWFLNEIEKLLEPANANKNKEKRSYTKFTDMNNIFNKTNIKNEKLTKNNKNIKTKKIKNLKVDKFVLPKLRKGSCSKNKDCSRVYSGPELFNITGHWVFKWADGREEIRKHQTLSDWQFERAKYRKDVRDDKYEENWQFKRAIARESNRNDVYGKF